MKSAILSLLLVAVSAKLTFFSTCPTYTESSVSMSSLVNKWYKTMRDNFNPTFIQSDCATQEYVATSDSSIHDVYWRGMSAIYIFTEFYGNETGQIKCNSYGKCFINFWTWLNTDMNQGANYYILGISSGSYFVQYQCDEWFLGIMMDQQVALLTTTSSASSSLQTAGETITDNKLFDYNWEKNVVENSQSSCTYSWRG